MKIAAYCRVSTDKDEQIDSLVHQKEFFDEYARKNGHELVRLYADDGIILGTSQEVLAPQGFPDLVLIFIWPEINGPYGRLIRKCVELSPLPIRRAA